MENEELKREVKGIWIPIEVWERKDLSLNEKVLFAEVDSYTTKDKDCFMSDEYISKFLGINKTNANKTLSSLIKKGLVIKTRFDGRKRYVKAALSQMTTLTCQQQQDSYIYNNDSSISNDNNISLPIQSTNKESNTDVLQKKNDYQALLNYYNEHLTGKLPRAQKLSKQRIQFINARLREYDMETIYSVIDKCVQSSFLTGQKGDWHANFDWILLPTNFLKILEGNYDTDLCNCEKSLPKSENMVINGQIYR